MREKERERECERKREKEIEREREAEGGRERKRARDLHKIESILLKDICRSERLHRFRFHALGHRL